MATARDAIVQRAKDLIASCEQTGRDGRGINEAFYGALNLVRLVHGNDSVQEQQLVQVMTRTDKATYGRPFALRDFVSPAVVGALHALIAEVQSGLTGSVAMHAFGELLGDMLGLAREALDYRAEDRKNVAAVLVAAAFEDTLRRLGEAKAHVAGRPDLADVITALKKAGVIVGAAVSNVQGFLKFRNDALHADWNAIQESTIRSCLALIDALLIEHFS